MVLVTKRRGASARPRSVLTMRAFVVAMLLFLLRPTGAAAPSEYQVKAVFLYHFTQFVSWPETAFIDNRAPLIIGVLGEDPFGSYLDETVRDENVDGRPILVRRFERADEIGDIHLLFISNSVAGSLEGVLSKLRGRSILTIGDGDGYAVRGVMVRFLRAHNRIRLRINIAAVRSEGLSISSNLLRAAEIVNSEAEQARP